MERTYIKDLSTKVGQEAVIKCYVDIRRDQGKLIFFDFRDMTGRVQGVILPGAKEAHEVGSKLRPEWVVEVRGKVNKRPDKNIQKDRQNGDIELEILGITVLAQAEEVPFERETPNLTLETRLDHRPYTLRSQRDRDIFSVQSTILSAFRDALRSQSFTEFTAPVLVGGDAEGGSAVFEIPDYYGHKAFLATSGQLYKQIMVGPLERVLTIAKTFRAEKSATTRHLAEIVQLEFEMGFVNGPQDVMAVLEKVIRHISTTVATTHADALIRLGTTPALLPEKPFPVFTLREAQEVIEREFGGKCVGELDLEPEHERQICQYAREKLGSDFVFITRFPTKKRAFYTMADPAEPEWSLSFDLLFRGLEINSGAQRIHNYHDLVAKMKSRGMATDKFDFYLQAFKYGMPPHGGCSTGLERITARMLELQNVKEASSFPRDMHRIDGLLSQEESGK